MYKIELFENGYNILTRYSNKETKSEAVIDVLTSNTFYNFDLIKVSVAEEY